MPEVKDNVIQLEGVLKKLNVTLQENIDKLNAGATATANYGKSFSNIPSQYANNLKNTKKAIDGVKDSQEKLILTAKQLEQASIKQSNARNALNKQREQSIKQIEKENSAYLQLSKAEALSARALQDLIARGKLATQTQKQYNAEVSKAQAHFDLLRAKLIMADNATGRWSRTNERTIIGLKGLRTGVSQLMSAFGVFGGIYLFAQVIRDAFNTTVEFDKATADLAATMGTNRKGIEALTNSAKLYGATTIYTATQVTKLQKELAKLGFNEREILNSTKGILNLASAVDTDLTNAAEVGGSTLRAFNLDASEMNRVVDVMAGGFTKSALDIENFKESIKYVAPIANASNVSLEQTTALLGILADNGIKGSMAGTSLRRIMTDIVKTGKPFNEGLREVVKNGISVKDAFDEVGRTAQTTLVVLGKNIEKVDALNSSLNDVGGTAQKMADEQLNSLNGQITLMTSAWDGFILSLETGNGAISKVLGNLINLLTKAIEGWTFLAKTENERSKDVGSALGSKSYEGAMSAIFESNNKLKKEINSVNDAINKQLAILDSRPNDQQAKTNLANLKAQKTALEDLMVKEKEKTKADVDFAIPILQEKLDKTTSQIKNYENLVDALKKVEENEKSKGTLYVIKNADELNKQYKKRIESERILNELIVEEGYLTGELNAYRDASNQLMDKNIKGEETLIEIDKKKIKVKKELEQVETNSKIAFDRQISALQHQVDKTNIASAEYGILTFQLKLLKGAYDALYGSQEKNIDLQIGTISYYENEIKLLKEKQQLVLSSEEYANLERNISLYELAIEKIKTIGKETKEATNELSDWSKEFRKTFQDDFISDSGFDKIFFIIENFDKLKESGVDTALAISEAFQQAFNTIATASQSNFDAEYTRLEAQKEISIEFAGESATAKEEIEKQYEEKKREIQNRQAQSEKRLALFNIAINTAQAIVSALPNVPLSIAIGVIGAVQAGLVASQEIPQFWKGTDNAPEGWALTQEKGAEVITDKSGKIKTLGNNKGAQMTYLNKGDKVYKSHEDYINKELASNGIDKMGSYLDIQPNFQIKGQDLSQVTNQISNLAKAIKNKEAVNMTIYKDKITVKKGHTEIMNNRLNLKANEY